VRNVSKNGLKESLPVWDLSLLKPKDVELTLHKIDLLSKKIEHERPHLKSITPVKFLSLLKTLEFLKRESSHLAGYVHLLAAEDSSNEHAQALISKIQQRFVDFDNRLLFFSLWFKDLDDAAANRFINACGPFTYYLEEIRKAKPYTLSEKEERVINILESTGSSALTNIYSTLTTQFEFSFQNKIVSQNDLFVLIRNQNPQVRKDAYLSLLGRYGKEKDVLGNIYRNVVISWKDEHMTLRGYKSPLQVRNVANDIPDHAIDSLLRVCEKNQFLFHRFFKIKQKRLGLKKMQRFDLYAPIGVKEQKMKYADAIQTVLASYESFSPLFRKDAEKIISSRHVHARLQKNKNAGAFCSGVSTKIVPFVLLNFTGTPRDVSTIAHEFGHGVHFLLSQGNTEFTYDACLPLAETASIFGEMLFMEHLKKKNPKLAEELLYFKLEDIYASVIRQAGFVAFEVKAHQLFAEGKTIQEVSDVYLADLKKQLGSSIEIDSAFRYEWMYIPHIYHTPFYCYAYAFGNLLVLALWHRYQKEGASFIPKFLALLKKGGSESPVAITKAIGVDICSEAFWQESFLVVKDMIRSLEK
jgi:oligoendopeptidase F